MTAVITSIILVFASEVCGFPKFRSLAVRNSEIANTFVSAGFHVKKLRYNHSLLDPPLTFKTTSIAYHYRLHVKD